MAKKFEQTSDKCQFFYSNDGSCTWICRCDIKGTREIWKQRKEIFGGFKKRCNVKECGKNKEIKLYYLILC